MQSKLADMVDELNEKRIEEDNVISEIADMNRNILKEIIRLEMWDCITIDMRKFKRKFNLT